MPFATLQVPTVEVGDIVTTTIAFSAQGATAGEFDIEANNGLIVTYKPVMYA